MSIHPEAFAEPPEKLPGNRKPLGQANREVRDDLKVRIDDKRTEAAAVENTAQHAAPLRTVKDAEAVPSKPSLHQTVSHRDPLRNHPPRNSPHDKCSRLNCETGFWRYTAGCWLL
jgi:hypothetical protein